MYTGKKQELNFLPWANSEGLFKKLSRLINPCQILTWSQRILIENFSLSKVITLTFYLGFMHKINPSNKKNKTSYVLSNGSLKAENCENQLLRGLL